MVNGSLTRRKLSSDEVHVVPVEGDAAMTEPPNISSLNGLAELASRDGVDIRPTLLRVVTDLYVQKPTHSPQEEQHFTELALRLIDLVDAATRAIVADKIAGYPNAPAAVRRRLLREQVSPGAPVQPSQPTTADAEPFAGSKAAAEELSELFFAASAEERRLILLNLPYAMLAKAAPVPPATARDTSLRLEATALDHNSEAFARELERALLISHPLALRLIGDASGEPLVVAAVVLAMPAAVLQRILLCLNPAISHSVQRVYDLAVLYEEIELEAALRLLAIWQASFGAETKSAAAQSSAHQPFYAHANAIERALPPARPKIRWEEHARTRKSDSA